MLTDFCFSQGKVFENIQNQIEEESYLEALNNLHTIDTTLLKIYDKGLWFFYYGELSLILDKHDISFSSFLNSYEKFSSIDSLDDAADCDLKIVEVLSHQKNIKAANPFLDRYVSYAESKKSPKKLSEAYLEIGAMYWNIDKPNEAIYFFKKSIEESKKIKDTLKIASLEFNIGVVHNTDLNQPDSALHYFEKTLSVFKKYNESNYISYNYNNQAKAYELKGNHEKAAYFLKRASSFDLRKYDKKTRLIYYKNLAANFDSLKDFKNESIYLKKIIQLKDSIGNIEQNKAIAEANERYQNAELKAENLEEKAKTSKKNTQLIITLAILALVIISAYLLQKNTRKKQLLAEQAKDLEAQKVENLLQEQELASIDAMIEGQEKERKRIAEDLHDDLGALMATINLHLENVGSENNPNALSKTKSLLAEAYSKIRNMSHVKNAGVIANEGLLVAVKNIASKISSANKIDIEVIAHGLENRLENSLELSLFRTIQELITNSIKHAEATKATIQLTQFENSLNIIVEDDGKGFNVDELTQKGIGLNNIKKRMEHLEGTLTIDSTIGRGTTIVVDVPLQS